MKEKGEKRQRQDDGTCCEASSIQPSVAKKCEKSIAVREALVDGAPPCKSNYALWIRINNEISTVQRCVSSRKNFQAFELSGFQCSSRRRSNRRTSWFTHEQVVSSSLTALGSDAFNQNLSLLEWLSLDMSNDGRSDGVVEPLPCGICAGNPSEDVFVSEQF